MRFTDVVGAIFGLAFLWWIAFIGNHGRSSFLSDYLERADFRSRLSAVSLGMSPAHMFSVMGMTSANVHSLSYVGGASVSLMSSWATKRGMDNEVLPPFVVAKFTFPSQPDAIRASVCGERAAYFRACLESAPLERTWDGAKLTSWEVIQ